MAQGIVTLTSNLYRRHHGSVRLYIMYGLHSCLFFYSYKRFNCCEDGSLDWGYGWCSGTQEILGSFSDSPTGICLNSKPQAKGCACHFILKALKDVSMHLMVSNWHDSYDLALNDSLKRIIVRSHPSFPDVGPFCDNTEIIHLCNHTLFITIDLSLITNVIFPGRLFETYRSPLKHWSIK